MVASNILKNIQKTRYYFLLCIGLSHYVLQARNIWKFNIKETVKTMIDDTNYYSTKNWVGPAFSRNLNLWHVSRLWKTRMKCIISR